ncbi:hypothetical protein [Mycobacterium noviomagense]|uniref:UsfY protein n=1 Tax=Mycobacterium noviomagense TaxID=459858 RepID=A0A7I7PJ59_9MYCO|nr:hypothetical protein [Mycobacterium noviomagense]ORB11684.1 hypothetical protein BST37_18520 [Mycobacterium noviomagense]BBY08663.1 UsfY protein [Mycobacterium noviomagense]
MGDNFHDPVDHHRTTRPRAGESIKDTAKVPGLVLLGAGVVAFVVCLAAFAMGQVGVGVAAVVVALLSVGAGLGWLTMEGRRVRELQRQRLPHPPGAGR